MRKPLAPPRTYTAADAHALADRLERNQRPQGATRPWPRSSSGRCLPAGPPATSSCCRTVSKATDRKPGAIVRGGAGRARERPMG
jgi:hypothetical protein